MNKNPSLILAGIAITAIIGITDVSANEVFDKYCSSCHSKGGNIMNPEKTLSQEHLSKNSVDNIGSISALVMTGKAPMPAFGKQLSADQIAEVAKYVIDQAKSGWK